MKMIKYMNKINYINKFNFVNDNVNSQNNEVCTGINASRVTYIPSSDPRAYKWRSSLSNY